MAVTNKSARRIVGENMADRKIALVTGASRGAGRGIARGFGELGYTVYVTGRTSQPGSAKGWDGSVLPGTVAETAQEVTDRGYWETKANKKMLQTVDQLFAIVKEIDPTLELKYNKFYIGLGRQGVSSLFTLFRPRKAFVRIEPRLPRSTDLDERMEAAGLDVMDYDIRWGRYRINLQPSDIEKHRVLLEEITRMAFDAMNGD
jgi:hypothetical protein